MRFRYKIFTRLIVALLLIETGLLFLLFNISPQQQNVVTTNKDSHRAYFMTKGFYDDAYQTSSQLVLPERVYGGIVPHHLIVANKIAILFESLKKYQYKTIVLIGPDHFGKSKNDISLSGLSWQTPYGTIDINEDLLRVFTDRGYNIDDNLFDTEHSISSLVGFIKKSFPESKFLPIIVRSGTTSEELNNFANLLYSVVDSNNTIVLTSIDFSHEMTAEEADANDAEAQKVIEDFNFNKILNLNIDSPESLFILLTYLRFNSVTTADLIFHTNSGRLIGTPNEPTTSHMFFVFHNK